MIDASNAERERLRAGYEKLYGRATELEGELGRLLNNLRRVVILRLQLRIRAKRIRKTGAP